MVATGYSPWQDTYCCSANWVSAGFALWFQEPTAAEAVSQVVALPRSTMIVLDGAIQSRLSCENASLYTLGNKQQQLQQQQLR